MDQDAINLAKAIRQAETGNRPVAGKSGELKSRYQFLPSTWKSWSKQYLGIDNAPITLENENKVAYSKIKELKDKGLNPAQIASVWNSGSPKWEGKVGVNKMGVKYDVPLYVNRVYSEYQKVKGGQQATGTSLRSQYQQAQEPQVQTIEQQRADLQSQGMPVAKDPTRVNPTMGGMIARDILKTPAKMLENVKAIPKILQGQSFEQATAPRESKYFGGTIAPLGTQGNFGQNLKESIGAGAELASYLPFGKVVTGTATALKTGSKVFGKEALKLAGRRIGANAVEGLVGTAMYEGGKRLQGEKDRGSFGGALAYGTGGAVGLGVLGAGLSRGVRQGRRTLASLGGKIPEDIAQESTQRLKGAWTGVVDNYKDLRTFRNKQAKYGRNIEDILTEEVMVPEILDGKIDTQKLLPEVDSRIKAQAEQLSEYAKKFDYLPVKIDEVQKIAEGVIRDTPSLTATGEYKTALGELERRMAGLKDIYGETIVPSQLNVIRAEMNKITKAFGGDVFKQDVADAIADAVREKLDDIIQDDAFRRGNAKVGDLINIRKFLQKVDGKQVGGGRFSQAFAGIVGSIVGSEAKQAGLPVLGPVLGYLGGREISKQARQFAFGSAGPRTRAILRRIQRKNAIGQEIAEKSAKVEQKLLPARTSPVNKAYSTGKTIELPRRTASTAEKAERENLVLEKLKKGDEIKVGGEALEVTLKTSDGVVVKMEDGTKKFLKTSELANAKDMKDQNLYDGAMSEVESSMEVSQAGYRIFNDTGVGTEVKGVASTFPKWISEELRSKKLFDRVISKIRNNEALTSPSERKLYKEMTDEAVRRYNNVKDQAGKKQIFDASEFGGDQAFGAVAGIQMDEDGNLTFDKTSAIAGVAGMAVAKKAGVLKNVKKASGDLIEEAKKYKSAEEFVNTKFKDTDLPELKEITNKKTYAEGLGFKVNKDTLEVVEEFWAKESTPSQFYHVGEEEIFEFDKLKSRFNPKTRGGGISQINGLYLGRDPEALSNFYGMIIKDELGQTPKISSFKISAKWLDLSHRSDETKFLKEVSEKYGVKQGRTAEFGDALEKEVIERGYDGVRYFDPYATGEEFLLVKKPQTKLELTDIWNKSNKSVILPTALPYKETGNLTTKILKDLEGKTTVSKQYILDATNRGELKQVERDITRQVLDTMPDGQINVKEFADKVKSELLPLKIGTDAKAYEQAKALRNAIFDKWKARGINTSEAESKFPEEYKKLIEANDKMAEARPGSFGGESLKWENITLPENIRGNVARYDENIYQSPIKTSAGSTHYAGQRGSENYFGHTRTEDMADSKLSKADAEYLQIMRSDPEGARMANKLFKQDKTRRVIEVQSDLYQKSGMDIEKSRAINSNLKNAPKLPKGTEVTISDDVSNQKYAGKKGIVIGSSNDKSLYDIEIDGKVSSFGHSTLVHPEMDKHIKESLANVSKLQQYNDPSAHFRMIREEIKRAAQDGKTKLQFPTGETAMKIEGLGGNNMSPDGGGRGWFDAKYSDPFEGPPLEPSDLKVGQELSNINEEEWIITDVLGDGKFKAVPKVNLSDSKGNLNRTVEEYKKSNQYRQSVEEFDISGKVDTNNPIYKFYEKDVQKYLTKFGGKRIVDDKGVSWIEVPIKKEWAKMPVEAFAMFPILGIGGSKVISDDEEATTTKSGLFGNKITFTRKNKLGLGPVEKPVLEKSRNVIIEKEDIDELKAILFGEISNRDTSKKELEVRTILNTVLNRVKQNRDRGTEKSVKEILTQKNQYQAYQGSQYNKYLDGALDVLGKKKKEELDQIMEKIIAEIEGGTFKDNTDGSVFYIHQPDGSITYRDGSLFK